MRKVICFCFVCLVIISCGNKRKIPDVSGVKVDIEIQRFEQDFFKIDTTRVSASLDELNKKYPGFLQDYVFNILGLPARPDSVELLNSNILSFLRSYQSVKDSADKVFTGFDEKAEEVKQGLQFVKYYFPAYKLPSKLISFIGPINSYGNIITTNILGVGLQLYMGKNYSLYQSEEGQQMYPGYISRRFEADYIPVNCIRNIVDDMFPNNSAGRPLIEQMVEAGKRLYILDQLMPETADTLKTGYTKDQLNGTYKNEAMIWSFFVQNDLLYVTDPAVTKDYMNDAPKTSALGEASPGNMGQFVGWQIVKKWMEKNDKIKLEELMETNPKAIFDQAKYKP